VPPARNRAAVRDAVAKVRGDIAAHRHEAPQPAKPGRKRR
jgi:hypothetical protein